jgi:hypothetical protein
MFRILQRLPYSIDLDEYVIQFPDRFAQEERLTDTLRFLLPKDHALSKIPLNVTVMLSGYCGVGDFVRVFGLFDPGTKERIMIKENGGEKQECHSQIR